nr:unnamed protein product [Digitaria exilis]
MALSPLVVVVLDADAARGLRRVEVPPGHVLPHLRWLRRDDARSRKAGLQAPAEPILLLLRWAWRPEDHPGSACFFAHAPRLGGPRTHPTISASFASHAAGCHGGDPKLFPPTIRAAWPPSMPGIPICRRWSNPEEWSSVLLAGFE